MTSLHSFEAGFTFAWAQLPYILQFLSIGFISPYVIIPKEFVQVNHQPFTWNF